MACWPTFRSSVDHPALFGTVLARSVERAPAVLLQFPPPAVQVAGMHLQRAADFGHALSTVQAAHRRLLEIFGEFSSRLHVPVFRFNDFQG